MRRSREDFLAYARDMLARDPSCESDSIIARRGVFVAGTTSAGAIRETPAARTDDRESVRESVADLHRDYRRLAPADFEERVRAIDARSHPDLAEWIARMQRAHAAAPSFAAAEADPRIPNELVQGLLTIAIASEERAAGLRSRLLDRMELPGSSRIPKQVQRSHPELHALDPEFFQRMRSMRRDRELAKEPSRFWAGAGAVWLILYLVRKLFSD